MRLKNLMLALSLSACTLGLSATAFAQVNPASVISNVTEGIAVNAQGVAIDTEGYDNSFDEEFAKRSMMRSARATDGYLIVDSYLWKTDKGAAGGSNDYYKIVAKGARVSVKSSTGLGSYAKVSYNGQTGYIHKDNLRFN